MFKPLGLFTARCPDPHCKRPTCFFKHGEPSSSASPAPTPTESTASRPRLASQSSSNGQQVPSVKRKAGDDTAPSASPLGGSTRDARSVGHTPQPRANDVAGKDVKKPKIEPLGKGSPMSIVSSSKGSETNKVKAPMTGVSRHWHVGCQAEGQLKAPIPGNTAPVQRAVASSTAIPANLSLPPSLPRSTKMSPQPFADRQKARQSKPTPMRSTLMTVATLFQQYSKLVRNALLSVLVLADQCSTHRSSLLVLTLPINRQSLKKPIPPLRPRICGRINLPSTTQPSTSPVALRLLPQTTRLSGHSKSLASQPTLRRKPRHLNQAEKGSRGIAFQSRSSQHGAIQTLLTLIWSLEEAKSHRQKGPHRSAQDARSLSRSPSKIWTRGKTNANFITVGLPRRG
jgi:hypothetical protein